MSEGLWSGWSEATVDADPAPVVQVGAWSPWMSATTAAETVLEWRLAGPAVWHPAALSTL